VKYYSSDAAPTAMFEYAKYIRDEQSNIDSAVIIFNDLTKRYLIETSVGAKAQLEIVGILLAAGDKQQAMNKLQQVASAHSDDAIGTSSSLQLADLYYQTGAYKKALDGYTHIRETAALSSEQLAQSYLGSGRSYAKLSEKKKAILDLRKVLSMRGISASKKEQAQELLQVLAPAKKTKKKK
jgi:tetratricopeptide (TPR) repeat protein